MFACEHASVSPDIICLSKGLTAGYLPLSLVVVTDNIYNAFYSEYTEQKAFLHSHSYTGNPLACSVALESLNIFKEDNVLERNKSKAEQINKITKNLANKHPYIGEFRQIGMIGALELVEDKVTKQAFAWEKRVGYNICKLALKEGLLLRPLGNVLYFMPPYIIEEKDIERMVTATFKAINNYFGID